MSGINIETPTAPLLEAFVAEKSGFKGFRLRIEAHLLDGPARTRLMQNVMIEDPRDPAVPPVYAPIYVTRYLTFAGAPENDEYEDVFWMVDDKPAFNRRDEQLTLRLRHSGRVPAEAEQAAMTKVVFEEVRAIAEIIRR